jgi:hypothetical protein
LPLPRLCSVSPGVDLMKPFRPEFTDKSYFFQI